MKRFFLRKFTFLPYFPIVFTPWVLVAPLIFRGQAIFWGTPFLQFVPWRAWAWDVLLQGNLPLWNPLVGMGAPLIANYQSALFYPPNWLLLVMQGIGGVPAHAWGQAILIGLHLVWAGVGMVWLSRDLGFSPLAQTLSGLAYSLSGYLVSRSGFLSINAAAAWMPWVIWSLNRALNSFDDNSNRGMHKTFSAWLPFILCSGMQLLSGHAQTAWYTFFLAGLWALLRLTQQRYSGRFAVEAVFAILLAAGLAAVQLIPTAEYLLQSQRAANVDYDFAMNYSLEVWSLVTFILPFLFGSPAWGDYWLKVYFWETAIYIGTLPFLLAMIGGMRAIFRKPDSAEPGTAGKWDYRNRWLAGFLLGVSGIALVFALGKNTPIFPFLYRYVPTFDMFQAPARFSLWAVFALALLVGMGVDGWRRPEGRGLYWTRLLTAGAFAIALGSAAAWVSIHGIRITFIQAMALAGLWLLGAGVLSLVAPRRDAPSVPMWWGRLVVLWVAIDLLVAGWGLIPATEVSLYRNPAPNLDTIQGMLGGHRLYLTEADEDTIKFERFFGETSFNTVEDWDLLRAVYLPNANMLDQLATVNNFDPLQPATYARWMAQVNALPDGERAAWLGWMDASVMVSAGHRGQIGVDLSPIEGASRYHWSACPEYVDGDSIAWEATREGLGAPPAGSSGDSVWAVVEGVPTQDRTCSSGSSEVVEAITDDPGKTVLWIDADTDGWVIVSSTEYPGWTARIDGQAVPINRANGLFRAVHVPAGQHSLEMVYRPVSFILGACFSLLAGLFMIVGYAVQRRFRG